MSFLGNAPSNCSHQCHILRPSFFSQERTNVTWCQSLLDWNRVHVWKISCHFFWRIKKNSTICHPLCLKMQNRNYLKIAVRRGPCRRQYLIRFRQIGNIVFWNLIYAKRRLLLKFRSHIITAFNYCIAILAKSIFNIR